MFCSKCGVQTPEGKTLCDNCTKATVATATPTPTVTPAANPAGKNATQINLTVPDVNGIIEKMGLKGLILAALSFLTVVFSILSFNNWFSASAYGESITLNLSDTLESFIEAGEWSVGAAFASIIMMGCTLVFIIALILNIVATIVPFVNKFVRGASVISTGANIIALVLGFFACTVYGLAFNSATGASMSLGMGWAVWLTVLVGIVRCVVALGVLDSVLDSVLKK